VTRRLSLALLAAAAISMTGIALAGAGQQAVLDQYAALAKTADPAFAGFSADRGKAFFLAKRTTNADTPSCSACHTSDPHNTGQTTVGQAIAPMAVSATPDRFTDMAKTEKWFRRNCNTVLGRECTPMEKGDFIAFMASQ
jgi:cytochrome c peroxidase